MLLRLLLLATLALATPLALAADYSSEGKSTISVGKDRDGNQTYTTLTTSFSILHDYSDAGDHPLLLKKAVESVETAGRDGIQAKIQLEVRSSTAKTFDHKLWGLSEVANDARAVEDGLLVTWLDGCCDSATSYRALNMKTGKIVVAYDDQAHAFDSGLAAPLVIEVPNSQPELKRFLGVITPSATRDFKPGKTSDGLEKLATVTYANVDGRIQGFDIFGKITEGYSMGVTSTLMDTSAQHKNELRKNRLTLWSSDGLSDARQAFKDFALQITFTDDRVNEIRLPFAADRLENVVAPAGFRVIPTN